MDRHNTTRSFNGCWTCRLRRKKCDEYRPICDTCSALQITCYYDQEKPDWMDGGAKQEEMANRLKREVKESRRGDRNLGHRHAIIEPTTYDNQKRLEQLAISETPRDRNNSQEPHPETANTPLQREHDCKLASKHVSGNMSFARSDTILLTFHLEYILPFLFPFYNPSILEGGRSWILEMMISSPVVRQATLCQSSYFFSLARGVPSDDSTWETVLAQTRDAFCVLRQSLQFIHSSSITEHLHGAVRILASVMQIQRFEVAVLSFENCQAHLNAALAIFRQLLDSSEAVEPVGNRSRFASVISLLGPATRLLPAQGVHVPSAEQAAFRFSSALLLFDDIIASTVSQEQPKLYDYHRCLLHSSDGTEPPINFETVVGCQNWVLLHISEIAMLDTWKQGCKSAGNLNMIDLVHRATPIKDSLEAHLTQLGKNMADPGSRQGSILLEMFMVGYSQHSKTPSAQTALVTQVWAHATLLYLSVVVSGWQPASVEVRYHVDKIIELLTLRISPPALLRTMVWPFCVAGCLAEPARIPHFRAIADALQPSSVFGTVRKALEIMENVWRNQDAADNLSRDLATCFRNQGDLVLLV
ncbi:Transcriptional regulatory protein UME6 [Talaromyces pinophilus]|nr:Transcriptional regulatory protein UME6 [Talaromyces pinophilus]